MAQQVIGRVGQLWRYPVKSMAGEALGTADIDESGIIGDRNWAPRDEASGEITNCKVLPSLLMCAAHYADIPRSNAGISHAVITLPDGRSMRTDNPFIAPAISAIAGRPVTLWPLQPASDTEHYRQRRQLTPEVMRQRMGLRPGDPDPDFSIYESEIFSELQHFVTPRGSYKDAYPIHFITSASLATIQAFTPGINAEARRFRPNLMIETFHDTGFPEHDWTGFDLIIGDVVLHCGPKTVRCAMPAQPQQGLVAEPRISAAFLRLTAYNLGAYAFVRHMGTIAVGDEVILETKPRQGRLRPNLLPLPSNTGIAPPTDMATAPGPFKKMRVASKTPEADDVISFKLRSEHLPCTPFVPGQHLTFRLKPSGSESTLIRSYSISSSAPHSATEDGYSITVKRIGAASAYLHDIVLVGDELDVRWPTGRFFSLPTSELPLILISNGIGITPLFSMLRSAALNTPNRKIFWVHATRDSRTHVFKNEVNDLSRQLDNFNQFVIYTKPDDRDVIGQDYHSTQYIREQDLLPVADIRDAELFLCGTPSFMSEVRTLAKHHGIRDHQIHTELFGAQYKQAGGVGSETMRRSITFARSGIDAEWTSGDKTLLEIAEELGITVDYGCRFGACQACSVGLIDGSVTYPDDDIHAESGRALLCCAKPLSDLTLDL